MENTLNNQKEIRPVLFTEQDFNTFDEKFRILCALENQTIGERFAELMNADLKKNEKHFSEDWTTQQGLIEALANEGITITRQTLRTHRTEGKLPSDCFVESKIDSDLPNAKKNQRTYYRTQKCIEFYKNN